MARRKNVDLEELCNAAWRDLPVSDRRAARLYMARTYGDLIAPAIDVLDDQPQLSLCQALKVAAQAEPAAPTMPAEPEDGWWDVPPVNLHEEGYRGKWQKLARMLDEQPGRYRDLGLRFDSYAKATQWASNIRTAHSGSWKPAGRYDATARENPQGVFRVFVCRKREADR
ncbi:hypothetical protein JS533_001550 [Bifidobacterium amazonense]|uniref:Uncharacterized protein n=1 Tax=Bifidobacterium amazonense TaxID=2809027 RepID=A0ABS9VSB5_9BIFI|nr:hypothetical protein [Bifidobacterium amazonense]MCH9274974.1 hypothetical protein [Bifidobacterium amazonense]